MKTIRAVRLTRADWEEIYAALDTKKVALERGEYAPCMEHGPSCSACDIAWIEHLGRILEAIGPDGHDAADLGVEAIA